MILSVCFDSVKIAWCRLGRGSNGLLALGSNAPIRPDTGCSRNAACVDGVRRARSGGEMARWRDGWSFAAASAVSSDARRRSWGRGAAASRFPRLSLAIVRRSGNNKLQSCLDPAVNRAVGFASSSTLPFARCSSLVASAIDPADPILVPLSIATPTRHERRPWRNCSRFCV